jgi:hypothetical protein
MKKISIFILAFILVQKIVVAADPVALKTDSYLVSYDLVKTHTKGTIKALWKENKIPKIILPVKNDVDIYEIVYKAPWIDGTWIEASGLCYVPKVKENVPVMMYGHGTQIHKDREVTDKDPQQGICLGFATDGYLALFPDYYGIGKGNSRHLYQHAWSEAMSYIYMLYAVEELKAKIGLTTNGQLFITGYSQGGHSSFAAQKYIEALNDPRFKITASSPMSGAYDMTGEQEKYMFQEYPRPFYLPYLLISYQAAYHILDIDNVYSIFKSPYDTMLPNYFEANNDKNLYDLDKLMPKIPIEIVKEEIVKEYLDNPDFLFKERLEENNLIDWQPQAPVQFCYCKGDREVNYKNSEVAYAHIKALGVKDIKLNNLSDHLDHNTCAAFAVMATKYYFDRFKDKGKNPKMKDVPKFKKMLANIVKKKEEKKYLEGGRDVDYTTSHKGK